MRNFVHVNLEAVLACDEVEVERMRVPLQEIGELMGGAVRMETPPELNRQRSLHE